MPTNLHASIRYEVLDRELQRESEENTEKHLRTICSDAIALEDIKYEATEVSLRTFRTDIAHIKRIAEDYNVEVLCKLGRKGYYYYYSRGDFSIFKKELSDSEVGQLKCAMQLLSRFKGLPEYDNIEDIASKLEKKYGITTGDDVYVEYEHVDSTGEEIMADICNCIINKQPLKITYMPYGKPEKKYVIHPYLLKEYNNRWFLFGYNEDDNRIVNAPLDRIRADYEYAPNTFIPNTFIDFGTYFNNVVGVTVNEGSPIPITLRASEKRYPYIESKPIHHSQQLINSAERIFTINVIPNKELDSLILSFGKDLEVLEPDWYRNSIRDYISDSNKLYNGGQDNCTPSVDFCIEKQEVKL